jgi:mono/diheme cytochrome c family protein
VNRAFATFGIGLLTAASACTRSGERERVDFERMRLQQRYDLYQASRSFANGAADQAPPPGTIARERANDTGSIGSGLTNGLAVTSIPTSVGPQALALGAQKFAIHCAVCHGPAGFGGSLVASNMGPPRPPSLRSTAALGLPAGYIFSVATLGKGRMPPYAPQLSTDERWAVAAYVKQLQRSPVSGPAEVEDSLRALEITRVDSAVARRAQP